MATKRTYQPSKVKEKRTYGFRNRDEKIVKRRRAKGRKKLTK